LLLCYIDEAGNTGTYDPADPASTPVFVVVSLSVDEEQAADLLMGFLRLKIRFEPTLQTRRLSEVIRHEVKGATLRRHLRGAARNPRRRALGLLDHFLRLLETHDCRIFGRVLVKQPGTVFASASTYPSAVAELAQTFDHQATSEGVHGLMILDSQTKVKNEGNVHTITTRRFRAGGSLYPGLVESPVFGHSDTHTLLQIADLLASALIYPAACSAYLAPQASNAHLHPSYQAIRGTFGRRLANIEHRYRDPTGVRIGGFRVIDRGGQGGAHLLFRP